MRSIGNGGVTIVTILVLIFSTWFGADGSRETRLTGVEVETYLERCEAGSPCPLHRFELRTVLLPVTVP